MTSETSSSRGTSCLQWFKQCLLVTVTIGLEMSVTLEVIFMIANIQTLGVPIRYSSLPGTISAAMGVFLIPTMGIVMDRWAKSKSAKAMILIGTCSIEILGNVLIFTANAIKLVYYDDPEVMNGSTTLIWPNSTQTWISSASTFYLGSNTLRTESSSNYTSLTNTTLHSLMLNPSGTGETEYQAAAFVGEDPSSPEEENVRFYAILAMIGYCFLDCGYDSSNCFTKTFALASTPPKDHTSVISKAVFVSSFGGCFIAVLGSVGLGRLLTEGTTHDASATQSAFVALLCFIMLITGLITTLTTGFCCSLSSNTSIDDSSTESPGDAEEKSPLMGARSPSRDLTAASHAPRRSIVASPNVLEKSVSGRFSGHAISARKSLTTTHSPVLDHAELSTRPGLVGFVRKYKRQIIVSVFTFFVLGSLYSFEVYAVNFVGYGIYDGNPLEPVGSEAYQNYVYGIEVGSQGTLIYYVVFTICTSMNEVLLQKIGWKIEVFVTVTGNVIVNLVCALTVSLWSYYVAAVWTGIFRAVVVTVPYILASRFSLEEGTGKDSGVAIAAVAAMLPLGFSVSSALMGPLIDATGDPATPLYYTAVTSFLGIVVILFLKAD